MRRGLRIVAPGVVAIAIAGLATRGDFYFGFGKGPVSFAVHCGVLYLIVGMLDLGIGGNETDRTPLVVALVSIPVLFVLSAGLLYLDMFVVTPRPYSKPSISAILIDRLTYSFVVGIASLGYPIGMGQARDQGGTAWKAAAVGTVLWASSLVVSRTLYGTAPGFTEIVHVLLGIAAVFGAIPLYFAVRRDRS